MLIHETHFPILSNSNTMLFLFNAYLLLNYFRSIRTVFKTRSVNSIIEPLGNASSYFFFQNRDKRNEIEIIYFVEKTSLQSFI